MVPTTALRFLERDKLMTPPDDIHYIIRERVLQQLFWNSAGTKSEWRDVPIEKEQPHDG
jgi:hypothetical protein